tara:strand:+ start:1801 stop:4509 length:2709 start_codon:yes stop_codon:yes gene_type:complete
MANSYTRQSSISDGDTITAAIFNNEYNQLLNAFAYSSSSASDTGHRHDGSTGQGGNVSKLGDIDFLNKVEIDSTNNRVGFYVEVSSSAVEQIRVQDGAIVPVTDNDIDLGTSSLEFKDLYVDGTAYVDAINFDGTAISATAAEINLIDGSSAGTIVNSKAVIYGSSGEVNATTLQIAGTSITSTAAELNILDGVTSTTAELNILDGVTSTATELNVMDGDTSATSTTLADADRVVVNDNGTMKQVALTDFETYFEAALDTGTNLTTVGALNAGSITSGFGAIDIGSSNLTATGTVSLGATSFNDNNITNVGSIQLDSIAGDADTNSSIAFSGSDVITMTTGGTTALTIDASQNVTIAGDLTVTGDDITMGTNTAGNLLIADGTNFNSIAVGSLSEISTVASDDVLLAVDTSGGGLKKITRSTLVSGLATSSGISNVVEDTSPQLGGDLDVNGNELVSTSNGNIALTPNGTGVVRIDGNVDIQTGEIVLKNGGSVSNIKFYCESSNAHYTQLQSAAHSAYSGNVTLTLPVSTDTLVGRATTDTLTNKTINASNNTLSNIPMSATSFVAGTGVSLSTNTLSVDAAQTGITSLLATDIKIGEDDQTKIDFEDADKINFYAGNEKQLILEDGALYPGSDNIIDLGKSDNEFKDAFFDGTVTADAFAGPLTGDVTGNVSGTAATVTGAAQSNITSLGTLTTLTVDNVIINGTTIGHTDDTDLLTFADGILTVAGEVSLTTLDIGGTNVTATAAELNILDGVTATTAEINYLDITTLGTTEASKVVTSDANGVTKFDNGIQEESTAVTSSSGSATLNLRDGSVFTHTLSEDVTYTFSNPAASGYASSFTLKVTQDSSARTITWPGSVDWAGGTAPTLSTGSGDVDVFVFMTVDGGTIYYGFTAGQDMT